MTRSISVLAAVIAGMVVAAGTGQAQTGTPPVDSIVLRMEVVGSGGKTEGTCILLHQERRERDVVHYFLTSAHLVNPAALGESRPGAFRIRVFASGTNTIDATGADVLLAIGAEQGMDLAVVRAVSTNAGLVPAPVVMESPAPGDVFVVWGRNADGSRATVAERVGFRSTRLVIGDRAATGGAGVVGAPAVVSGGVFGIVSEESSIHVPVVALLSAARGFLARAVPGWTPTASPTPAFELEQRTISGPTLLVACNAVSAGDVDVPVTLGPREKAVDATANVVNPRALRLADVTVLALQDKLVKLRFMMMGSPPPAFPSPAAIPSAISPPCPQGQALVTVGVNVLVLPRR